MKNLLTVTAGVILLVFGVVVLSSCIPSTILTVNERPLKIEVQSSLDKDALFVKANLWMVDVFNNAESIIQYSDKEASVLKGKYLAYNGTGAYDGFMYEVPNVKYYITITVNTYDNLISMTLILPSGDIAEENFEHVLLGVEHIEEQFNIEFTE
jgi:hypothetical protein